MAAVSQKGVVLVTGGAGFIGSHLVQALVKRGLQVRVLDTLLEQVHGSRPYTPPPGVEFLHGDIRNRAILDRALEGVEVVFHEAAEVGVGQSMYQAAAYVSANTLGTAALLQAMVDRPSRPRKLLVASSMSIYGEGACCCVRCGPETPSIRQAEQLRKREWELRCPECGRPLEPMGTTEDKPLDPTSVYAITKQDQEQLCLVMGRAYGIPTVALRYFNVYGAGQALSNPYTGVAAIFSSRLLNGKAPLIFEDGEQSRDFVHVDDIVQANLLAMDSSGADYQAINVGTGRPTSVRRVAELLAHGLGVDLAPEIVGRYREGDIRHCIGDISKARSLLNYEPGITLEQGIPGLVEWVKQQDAQDSVERATSELDSRGLVR